MHNPDDKYPTRSGFEPSTSMFRATTGPNEPSGPAVRVREHMVPLLLFVALRV